MNGKVCKSSRTFAQNIEDRRFEIRYTAVSIVKKRKNVH